MWVVRHLQIIGEAASRLPEDVRIRASEIPWPQVIGMRHVLVHGYFAIDTEIVWQTVVPGLPPLRTAVERSMAHDDGGPR